MKKLKEQIKIAEEQRNLALALRWTEKVMPDVAKPEAGSNVKTQGFIFNCHTAQVDAMWSESTRHGRASSPVNGYQGSISMYSTKLLALKALRHEIEVRSAEALRDIDKRIAAELEAVNK